MRRDIYNLSQIRNWLGRVMAKVFRDVSSCIRIPLWLPVFANRTTLASRCLKVVPLAPWGRTGRIALPSWKRRQGWLGCRNRRRLSKFTHLRLASHGKPWQANEAIQKSPKVTKKYIEAKWKKEVKLLHMIAPESSMSLHFGVSEIGPYRLPPKYQSCNS